VFILIIIFVLVPSENKKDSRSIEQTLADIQKKKRMKLENRSSQNQTSASNK